MPATFAPTFTLPLPTLDALNDANACDRVVLNLLRSLYSSDFTFLYSLLKDDTVRDICDTCTRLLDAYADGYPAPHATDPTPFDLTPAEYIEARGYIKSMLEHLDAIASLKNSV